MTIIFSVGWLIRVILLLAYFAQPYAWTTRELMLTGFRTVMFAIGSAALIFRLCSPMGMIWIVRFGGMGAFAEQAGIKQIGSPLMLTQIMFAISAGILLPSFKEFFFCCTVIFLVKPIAILLFGSDWCPHGIPAPCPGTDLQTLLLQNFCLVCTGIGVFYHLHSDARRDWLLSFEVFGPLNDTAPASSASVFTPATGPDALVPPCVDGAMETASSGAPPPVYGDLSARDDSPPCAAPADDEEALPLEQDAYFPPDERDAQRALFERERAAIAAAAAAVRARPPPRWALVPGAPGLGRSRSVRRALADGTGERLAVKLLPGPARAAHAELLRREAHHAMALGHPALAAVRGWAGAGEGGAGGGLCVATEYCGGGSVEALLLRARRPLAADAARRLAAQAAAGLGYLHRHRLMHGNLKV
jgi:hypothetical protein